MVLLTLIGTLLFEPEARSLLVQKMGDHQALEQVWKTKEHKTQHAPGENTKRRGSWK